MNFLRGLGFYAVKFGVFMAIACLGIYVGYRIKEQKQKMKNIDGSLLNDLNNIYKKNAPRIYRNNGRSYTRLYDMCCERLEESNIKEIRSAKAAYKEETSLMDIMSLVVAIAIGEVTGFGVLQGDRVDVIVGASVLLLILGAVLKFIFPRKRQAYLLSVLEDAEKDK